MGPSPSPSASPQPKGGNEAEYRAMKATIEAKTKQFVLERRLLEARQKLEMMDQQSRVRAAQMNVLEKKQRLLELQSLCQRVGC
jgi:hypothetical protein